MELDSAAVSLTEAPETAQVREAANRVPRVVEDPQQEEEDTEAVESIPEEMPSAMEVEMAADNQITMDREELTPMQRDAETAMVNNQKTNSR
mmetsp:Transcript_38892/g.44392  ORF Transcript_38892/g.44392 Transcript_38892/m.44392 type:complete len:92 (+) Transcript_38892:376-651(+)